MSREVKRVALDFEWPLNKVWKGFVRSEDIRGHSCSDCDGGATATRQWLEGIAHIILMLDDDLLAQRAERPIHPWLAQLATHPASRPSPDAAELGLGLAGRSGAGPFGHDAIDRWRTTAAIIKAAGLDPETWGICPTCKGTALAFDSEEQRAAHEAWEPYDPPAGDGWQVWETVSEGSPITPVFTTPEGLARNLSGYDGGPRYDQSLAWIKNDGWAPTAMVGDFGLITGQDIVRGGR